MNFCSWVIEMKIELELHKVDDALLLESTDIYKYIGEATKQEMMLAYYIDQWCKSLNYPLLHNQEMAFGDPEKAMLDGWIAGYNFAKNIDVSDDQGCVIIHHGKYEITLNKPFAL